MNLIIIGPQGSGKGTQAELLADNLKGTHIDVGKLLRSEIKNNSGMGAEIDEIINSKKELVPNRIIGKLLKDAASLVSEKDIIILDGAPRTLGQVQLVENILGAHNRKDIKIIFINISKEESIRRISSRYQCSICSQRYVLGKDIQDDSEKCKVCGGKISRRKDDTEEGVKKRLAVFRQETLPVVEHYRNRGSLLEINGEQEIEKVFRDIVSALGLEAQL